MKHLLILILFLLLISICCFLSCDKKPTDPDPEDGEHLFYISAAYGVDSSIVKIFSVEQLKFIDSLIIDDFRIGDMAVIGDNEMLMVSEGFRTRVYDLETKDMVHSADGYGYPLQISPNSEYYQAFDDRLQIRTTEDFQLIYSDTEPSDVGDFSFDSKYYVYSRITSEIIFFNLDADSIESSFNLTRNGNPYLVEQLWPSGELSKLYLLGMGYLAVYHVNQDTIYTLQNNLNRGTRDVIIDYNNDRFYFINTPSYTDDQFPSEKIDVYDTINDELIESISTSEYDDFEPKNISLTSDGKYLMATPWAWEGSTILLVDALGGNVIENYDFGGRYPQTIITKR